MKSTPHAYSLDEQVGFLLRRVTQRHLALFAEAIPELTTMQFAALAKLTELGPLSQNQLGRETSMDSATIKGVVDRLRRQGLVATEPDPDDRRRLTVLMTPAGAKLFETTWRKALGVTAATLEPLSAAEAKLLSGLLARMC